MKKYVKIMILAIVLLVLAPVKEVVAARTVEEIQESGQIVMGSSNDYPPFSWISAEGNDIVGIDIDIARLVAEELGVELQLEEMPFDSLIPAIQSGRIDYSLSAFTYTPERAEQILFSDSYYDSTNKFLIRTADENAIQTLEDLSGLTIGVQMSSLQETLARENIADAEIVTMKKVTDLVEGLKANKVDAVLVDSIVADEFIYLNRDTVGEVPDVTLEGPGGKSAIVAKDNQALVDVINQVISDANESGELDEIIQQNIDMSREQNAILNNE